MSRSIVAASIGGAWGMIGYFVLWGYTPFFPSRRFVVGFVGTVLFLPVKAVLAAIRGLESLAGRTFNLADNNVWIGLAAAAVGALIAVATFVLGRWAIRTLRRRRAVDAPG